MGAERLLQLVQLLQRPRFQFVDQHVEGLVPDVQVKARPSRPRRERSPAFGYVCRPEVTGASS